MEVSLTDAAIAFEKMNHRLQLPACFDPVYLLIDAKRDSALCPTFFVYEEQGELFYHGFHLAQVPNTIFFDIQSPYGYGGPISTSKDQEFLKRAWQEYGIFCKKSNVIAEFIRFHPLLQNWQYYQGEAIVNRETVYVNLEAEDLIATYAENRVRTAVRKGAKNGVQVSLSSREFFLDHFKELYRDSMQRMQTSDFYLFNDEYIDNLCSWEKSFLVVAKYEERVLTVLLGLINGEILELHLFGSSVESNKLCATNLIYHEAFLMAKEKGCCIAHFGGGNSNDEQDPLFFFKLGFSKKTAEYRIGKFIHKPEIYKNMAESWERKMGRKVTRILFYRD